MITAVDVERESGQLPRRVASQECGTRADILDRDEVVGRRPLGSAREQLVERYRSSSACSSLSSCIVMACARLLLGFFCFFLTLVPVGTVLIWLPATIWLFAIGETGWAIFLIAWSIMVFGVLEALLRTFLVSRGSDLPMLLILLGLFGGLLTFGFIGLFL
jgi:hypothetical protein